MSDLTAIVRATRASARALQRMAHLSIILRHARGADYKAVRKTYDRAMRDYQRAQETLRANPLPGDKIDV